MGVVYQVNFKVIMHLNSEILSAEHTRLKVSLSFHFNQVRHFKICCQTNPLKFFQVGFKIKNVIRD